MGTRRLGVGPGLAWLPASASPRALPLAMLDDLDSYLMRTMTTDHAPFQINPGIRFGRSSSGVTRPVIRIILSIRLDGPIEGARRAFGG